MDNLTAHERELVLALREYKKALHYHECPLETPEEFFEEHRAWLWLETLAEHIPLSEPDSPATLDMIVEYMADNDALNVASGEECFFYATCAPDRDPWRAVRDAQGVQKLRDAYRAQWMRDYGKPWGSTRREYRIWLSGAGTCSTTSFPAQHQPQHPQRRA